MVARLERLPLECVCGIQCINVNSSFNSVPREFARVAGRSVNGTFEGDEAERRRRRRVFGFVCLFVVLILRSLRPSSPQRKKTLKKNQKPSLSKRNQIQINCLRGKVAGKVIVMRRRRDVKN